jgi:putative hemolysin
MDIVILLALIALNGVFALSELAIVSSRRTRLQMRADKGDRGAKVALKLQEDPSSFLSTVQVGITLIGIIAGAYGATALAEDVAPFIIETFPALEAQANLIAFSVVIAATTYLSIVIGELVPKRVAITAPEAFASLIAPPMALLSRVAFPVVYVLRGSTNLILQMLGLSNAKLEQVTEEEIENIVEVIDSERARELMAESDVVFSF